MAAAVWAVCCGWNEATTNHTFNSNRHACPPPYPKQLGNDVPTPLKHPLTKGDLLAALAPRDRVRLVGVVVAGEGIC